MVNVYGLRPPLPAGSRVRESEAANMKRCGAAVGAFTHCAGQGLSPAGRQGLHLLARQPLQLL
jgi:hypothetical protein